LESGAFFKFLKMPRSHDCLSSSWIGLRGSHKMHTIKTTEFNNQPEQSATKACSDKMVTKAWLQKAVLELTFQFKSY
jgi:hypothetical protein